MLVSIHVVARLFRLPVLRIDGDVVLLDDDRLGHAAVDGQPRRRELTAGRLLALAEAELAAVDDRRSRRPAHLNGGSPAGRLRERAPLRGRRPG